MPKDYSISTKEAQNIIIDRYERQYSMTAVRQLVYRNRKDLKSKKILGRIVISHSSLIAFLKKNTKTFS